MGQSIAVKRFFSLSPPFESRNTLNTRSCSQGDLRYTRLTHPGLRQGATAHAACAPSGREPEPEPGAAERCLSRPAAIIAAFPEIAVWLPAQMHGR